jgi:hypothetical protein
MEFEVLVLESHTVYDGEKLHSVKDAINIFIRLSKKYINPQYVPEEYVRLHRTTLSLMYSGDASGDKPYLVMLLGPITDEIYEEIKIKCGRFYLANCVDCSAEIKLHEVVCKECKNK